MDRPDAPAAVTFDDIPTPAQRVRVGTAAAIIGVDPRTVERWVDDGKLAGGRPKDPVTHEPIKGSWRWVDVRHAVALAVGSNLEHLVPAEWKYLIPGQTTGSPAGM